MEDAIKVDDQWYVSSTSSHTDDRTLALKQGELFALFDRHGDIQRLGIGEQGIYFGGTRYLSHFGLLINDRRPILLHSTIRKDNTILDVDLTNPDIYEAGKLIIPKDTVHLYRGKILWHGCCYEHIRLVNFSSDSIDVSLTFEFDSDFNDIFEVRGIKRKQRGTTLPSVISEKEIELSYEGLDNVIRRTRLVFSQVPSELTNNRARFMISLPPRGRNHLYLTTVCDTDKDNRKMLSFDEATENARKAIAEVQDKSSHLFTSNEQFNDWLNRSVADLHMLTTQLKEGPYPFAGVPWFSTPFGRDGIITALQYLWMNPNMAKGVLNFCAATQADKVDHDSEAEPGKIFHETRKGELASLGEIPFSMYYGTIDATPLFIVLAGCYYQRTGDRAFIKTIWPNIERALDWIDQYGDSDGDGFIEYARHGSKGLIQQGWKDSDDTIFHEDGRAAEGPIALCEVQGYVYQAKLYAASFAEMFGALDRAKLLREQARKLKENFNQQFWCEDKSTFAIALDGKKNPCRIRSSNAGHALFSGIAKDEYAGRVADTLLSDDSFSGWGIRTLAKSELRYNPMSYHNGSIWPHDNAIIAMGLARYGYKEHAVKILVGLFDASIFMDLHRLPELFCGFNRRDGQGPTLYPVACTPQAWASATVFHLLQTCLGLSFDPNKPQIFFHYPQLPDFLDRVEVNNLQISNAVVDLRLQRHPQDVGVKVLNKKGNVDITIIV